MDRIFLKKREDQRIRLGHPWIFDNEIGRYQGECPTGSPVQVYSADGLYLGTGIMNRNSRICVRIALRDSERLMDRAFFSERITNALSLRERLYAPEDSCRLVFAESDLIPGLIIDRFVSIEGKIFLSIQFLTLGIDIFRDEIISILHELISPDGIFERSDVHVRALEGLPERKGWIGSTHDPRIVIRENGVLLRVDVENGQKTGYFLDQKANRALVASLSRGMRVLDTFTHTGAFGLNAWKGGAISVESIDISREAIETVQEAIKLNGASPCVTAREADVFNVLKEYDSQERRFDIIVLDPPAFTKNARMVDKAYGGYKEINLRAMKILEPGGFLITCSCSHFFTPEHFYHMLQNAAQDAKRTVQIIERTGAGPDHPMLSGYPESDYLTCAVLRVW